MSNYIIVTSIKLNKKEGGGGMVKFLFGFHVPHLPHHSSYTQWLTHLLYFLSFHFFQHNKLLSSLSHTLPPVPLQSNIPTIIFSTRSQENL